MADATLSLKHYTQKLKTYENKRSRYDRFNELIKIVDFENSSRMIKFQIFNNVASK